MRLVSTVVLAGLVTAMTACSLLEPDPRSREEVRIGAIAGFTATDPRVEMPDSASAATNFSVRVRTYGNGCVRKGGVQAETGDTGITLTPWDYVRLGETCTDELRSFDHEVFVRVEEPGEIRVSVRGSQHPSGGIVTVERVVTIR